MQAPPKARPVQAAPLVAVVLVAILLISFVRFRTRMANLNHVAEEALQDIEKKRGANDAVIAGLELIEFAWTSQTPGLQMEAAFKIRNKGSVDVKDIKIECTHYSASGTRLGRFTRMIEETVSAGETRHFRDVKMGAPHDEAARTVAEIVRAKVATDTPRPRP